MRIHNYFIALMLAAFHGSQLVQAFLPEQAIQNTIETDAESITTERFLYPLTLTDEAGNSLSTITLEVTAQTDIIAALQEALSIRLNDVARNATLAQVKLSYAKYLTTGEHQPNFIIAADVPQARRLLEEVEQQQVDLICRYHAQHFLISDEIINSIYRNTSLESILQKYKRISSLAHQSAIPGYQAPYQKISSHLKNLTTGLLVIPLGTGAACTYYAAKELLTAVNPSWLKVAGSSWLMYSSVKAFKQLQEMRKALTENTSER